MWGLLPAAVGLIVAWIIVWRGAEHHDFGATFTPVANVLAPNPEPQTYRSLVVVLSGIPVTGFVFTLVAAMLQWVDPFQNGNEAALILGGVAGVMAVAQGVVIRHYLGRLFASKGAWFGHLLVLVVLIQVPVILTLVMFILGMQTGIAPVAALLVMGVVAVAAIVIAALVAVRMDNSELNQQGLFERLMPRVSASVFLSALGLAYFVWSWINS